MKIVEIDQITFAIGEIALEMICCASSLAISYLLCGFGCPLVTLKTPAIASLIITDLPCPILKRLGISR